MCSVCVYVHLCMYFYICQVVSVHLHIYVRENFVCMCVLPREMGVEPPFGGHRHYQAPAANQLSAPSWPSLSGFFWLAASESFEFFF